MIPRIPTIKYRIMSFNIKQFSDNSAFHKPGTDSKKDLNTIARIVNENNIDIIAIQEIRGKIAFKELISAIAYGYSKDITYEMLEQPAADGNRNLISELSGDDYLACVAGKWQGRWTHPNSKWGTAISEEGYAFIWNTDTVDLPRNDRGIVQPVIKHKNEVFFARPPFYGRFVTKTTAKFEIRLLNTHILYTKNAKYKKLKDIDANIDIELLNSPDEDEQLLVKKYLLEYGLSPLEINMLENNLNMDDVQRRRAEVKNLIREILTREEDKNGYGSYVFMLGDYNLNLQNSKSFKNTKAVIESKVIFGSYNDFKEYVITQDQLSTLCVPQKSNTGEAIPLLGERRFANNYDHFTYNIEMTKDGPNGRGIYISEPKTIDVMDIYGMSNNDYFDKISDHLPIYFEIGF